MGDAIRRDGVARSRVGGTCTNPEADAPKTARHRVTADRPLGAEDGQPIVRAVGLARFEAADDACGALRPDREGTDLEPGVLPRIPSAILVVNGELAQASFCRCQGGCRRSDGSERVAGEGRIGERGAGRRHVGRAVRTEGSIADPAAAPSDKPIASGTPPEALGDALEVQVPQSRFGNEQVVVLTTPLTGSGDRPFANHDGCSGPTDAA